MRMVDEIYDRRFLSEGLSGRVYHITNDPISVLSSDTLRASPAFVEAGRAEFPRSRAWFISVARAMAGSYFTSPHHKGSVILELDSEKLSQKYHAKAFNYLRDIPTYHPGRLELEDRIWLNEPALDDLHKYVLQIIVTIPAKRSHGVWEPVELRYPEDTHEDGEPLGLGEVRDRLTAVLGYGNRYDIPVRVIPGSNDRVGHAHTRLALSSEQVRDYLGRIKGAVSYSGQGSGFDWGEYRRGGGEPSVWVALAILHFYRKGWITQKMLAAMVELELFVRDGDDLAVNYDLRGNPRWWGDLNEELPYETRKEITNVLKAAGFFSKRYPRETHLASWFDDFFCDGEGVLSSSVVRNSRHPLGTPALLTER